MVTSQGTGNREQGTEKKLCVPHYYEKRYSHVGCVRDGKPLIFRLFAPGTGRPVTHHQSTPYSLLPTPCSLCYRLYS
ncbi:MAG: hypothetical protein F6J90_21000 [Moorea sp. SIOASIH]|uniref:hypothetical protein n=1 Tax=Moorena sp. SIOASIH TaxID=2607817 RepID=UPI0013BADDEB|nr:hypothetical protein [Moorena sp. SIOASIH]NEO38675.1 hypothetical protein [Moorena sp. SIOASIH]